MKIVKVKCVVRRGDDGSVGPYGGWNGNLYFCNEEGEFDRTLENKLAKDLYSAVKGLRVAGLSPILYSDGIITWQGKMPYAIQIFLNRGFWKIETSVDFELVKRSIYKYQKPNADLSNMVSRIKDYLKKSESLFKELEKTSEEDYAGLQGRFKRR